MPNLLVDTVDEGKEIKDSSDRDVGGRRRWRCTSMVMAET